MNREIIIHEHEGIRLVGTHHMPKDGHGGASSLRNGVLLLNPGPAPRAGNSDMSVAVCDRLAMDGIHAFRFDMPGLGDSFGESPSDIPSYWHAVLQGRNDRAAASLLAHLVRTFGIDGLAVGGLCAGAVTAIRLAHARTPYLVGLVLLEPNFRTQVDMILPRRTPASSAAVPSRDRPRPKYARLRRKVHNLCERFGLAAYPPETDVGLFKALRDCLERSVPVIAVLADGLQSTKYMDVVERQLSVAARKSLMRITVERTNHILTAGEAKALTSHSITAWARGNLTALGRTG